MAENVTTTISVDRAMFPKGAELIAKVEQVTFDGAPTGTFEITITAEGKRYVLPMEGTGSRDTEQFYAVLDGGYWEPTNVSSYEDEPTVTQADIDSAPAWVKAIKPVEVTKNE